MGYLLLIVTLLISTPAFAQIEISGNWSAIHSEDNYGNAPYIGDYTGIPMTDEARMRADSWAASIQTEPEWQCRPHSAAYMTRGPSPMRIIPEEDPISHDIVAYHFRWLRSVDRTVYMDGRPHPSPYALHAWQGFTTGEWSGNVLHLTTTHLKEDYVRRNGLPMSDKGTLSEYLVRRGDVLSWTIIAYDPVYLTEPLIRTSEYRLNLGQIIGPYPCTVVQEIVRERGSVPHWLPGTNPDLTEFANHFEIPYEATRGGAETVYPEYQAKLSGAKLPAKK